MEQRVCSKCGDPKAAIDFFVRDRRTGRRHTQCKGCYKVQRGTTQQQHYQQNREAYITRAKKRNTAARQELYKQVLDYLRAHPCPCGEHDPAVLEFHHRDPEDKEATVSSMLRNMRSWSRILVEVEKCDVLCANCHKRKTAAQFGWYRSTA